MRQEPRHHPGVCVSAPGRFDSPNVNFSLKRSMKLPVARIPSASGSQARGGGRPGHWGKGTLGPTKVLLGEEGPPTPRACPRPSQRLLRGLLPWRWKSLSRGVAELRPNPSLGGPDGKGPGTRRGAPSKCHRRDPRPPGRLRSQGSRRPLTKSRAEAEKERHRGD